VEPTKPPRLAVLVVVELEKLTPFASQDTGRRAHFVVVRESEALSG